MARFNNLAIVLALLCSHAYAQTSEAVAQSDVFSLVDKPMSDATKKMVIARMDAIEHMAKHPIIVRAAHRRDEEGKTLEEVKAIDAQWSRGECAGLVNELTRNDVSKLLRIFVEGNPIAYAEAIVCDRVGGTIGFYPQPTDYWQGDEEKFSKILEDGKLWVGPIVWDESTEAYTIPVSTPIFEDEAPDTELQTEKTVMKSRKILGVLYVGIRCIQRDLPITSETRRPEE